MIKSAVDKNNVGSRTAFSAAPKDEKIWKASVLPTVFLVDRNRV